MKLTKLSKVPLYEVENYLLTTRECVYILQTIRGLRGDALNNKGNI